MADLTLRCPRCRRTFVSDDADRLADELLAHAREQHGHAPPREHVVARIQRQENQAG